MRLSVDSDTKNSTNTLVRVGLGTDESMVEVKLPIEEEDAAWWASYTSKFTWYSYTDWLKALTAAVEMALYDIEAEGREAIYLAIHVGSPGGGAAGVKDPRFSQNLAKYPMLFYKSELWTLIHVLRVVGHRVKGVIWLKDKKDEKDEKDLEDLEDYSDSEEEDELSEHIAERLDEKSALLVPFDASYSGFQVESTLKKIRRRIAHHVAMYAAVGIARSGAFPEHSGKVVVGLEDEGETFAPQYKLPDHLSMDNELNVLLRCALCCSHSDVMRSPYKFYNSRRATNPEQCSTQIGSMTDEDDEHFFECVCPAPERPPAAAEEDADGAAAASSKKTADDAAAASSKKKKTGWFPWCFNCGASGQAAEPDEIDVQGLNATKHA